MKLLDQQTGLYLKELEVFLAYHPLPDECFERPDYVSVKCSNAADFNTRVGEIRSVANNVYFAKLDDRRAASAWCMGAISLGRYGSVSWVEVEFHPSAQEGAAGFRHAGFVYPRLDALSNGLDDSVIDYEFQSDKQHSWISVPINKKGCQVKFSDMAHGEIIRLGVAAGEVQVL